MVHHMIRNITRMRRPSIKVLEVPSWVRFEDDYDVMDRTLGSPRAPEVAPRFGRDGLYLDRRTGRCWLEFNGKAYAGAHGDFLYTLLVEDWEIIPSRETAALLEVVRVSRDTVLKQAICERLRRSREKRYLSDLRRGVDTWRLRATHRRAS